jgi:hypothetical protein
MGKLVGGKFRIATVTACFLRDLQPPAQDISDLRKNLKP